MGNDLDDKYLRKNTYVMSLLSLIGKGVENADWEKIGSGMIDFMRKANIEYGNEYRTDKIESFVRSLLSTWIAAATLSVNEEFLSAYWSEVFTTGNPAKWQEVMLERDTSRTGAPQICANEPTDFYPADNPLKATKWCPDMENEGTAVYML